MAGCADSKTARGGQGLILIALDYDGTYTEDPEVWELFIRLFKLWGHEVICVTMRPEKDQTKCSCMTYYTHGKAKREFLLKLGIRPDIWVDDAPEYILRDHEEDPLTWAARYLEL